MAAPRPLPHGIIFICALAGVLGLPLVLAWVALWIVIAMVVLLIIDHGLRGGARSDAARKR